MFGKKEAIVFILVSVVLAASISFPKIASVFPKVFLAVLVILLLNIAAKKIAAFYLESEIEIKIWQMDRYGWRRQDYLNTPFPIGIILPVVISLISLGNFIWLASLVFDVKPKSYRAVKRHGLYSFSEMTESHIGTIAAAGVFVSLFSAVIAYFLGFPTFAKLSVFYAFYNMLPFSDLDGNKIFFGNIVLWSFLAIITLIGLGYVFFLT